MELELEKMDIRAVIVREVMGIIYVRDLMRIRDFIHFRDIIRVVRNVSALWHIRK